MGFDPQSRVGLKTTTETSVNTAGSNPSNTCVWKESECLFITLMSSSAEERAKGKTKDKICLVYLLGLQELQVILKVKSGLLNWT